MLHNRNLKVEQCEKFQLEKIYINYLQSAKSKQNNHKQKQNFRENVIQLLKER